MVLAIQRIFEQKKLSISQRLGIILCLPRETNEDIFFLNWHPITLLIIFYNIKSSCIISTIRSTLDYLISETQSEF